MSLSFVDIHCHLLPGIDDGAKDWSETLAMARLAVDDGTTCIIATPHQLGNFEHNHGEQIRALVGEARARLEQERIPLTVLPGADVRIEPDMIHRLLAGDVLTLADRRAHVLLELPHELYLPLEPVLSQLAQHKITGILSHPERNQGILRQPEVLAPLVSGGCLMQITAGSLCGTFGKQVQEFCEWMLAEGLVHVVASDAHGVRSRRPLLRRAYERVCELTDESTAIDVCSRNPRRIAEGQAVAATIRPATRRRRGWSFLRSAG